MIKNLIPLNWLILAMLGLIWGMSFMGVELALEGFSPITIAAIRITIAAITLNFLSYYLGHKLPSVNQKNGGKILLCCLGMGCFSNLLPFSLLSWAQINVSSSFAGIAMAVVPLIVLPLSHFLLPNMKMTLIKVIGFIIGFLGIVILIGPKDIFLFENNINLIAKIACILASVCYALGSIITRLSPKINLISFSACSLLIASIFIIPLAIYFEGFPKYENWQSIVGVIYLGLFPTAIATVFLVYLINEAGPPFLSLVNYQVPVWALLIGFFILNENLPNTFVLALIIILFGLFISQYSEKSYFKLKE